MDSTNTIKYKILIENRDYTKWSIHDPITFAEIYNADGDDSAAAAAFKCNPFSKKYFNKDIFNITSGEIVHSAVREMKCIAGILVLEGNRTYGRTANKKRLLYRCIPDDKRLPIFLVPYEINLGFSKKILNKYVLFRYDSWEVSQTHPHGLLTETLGDVNNLESFYEYQLYRKSLQENNGALLSEVKRAISVGIDIIENSIYHNSNFMIEDRTSSHRVITIDNDNTVDFDDGISIAKSPDGNSATISIYISNVFMIIETLGLWDSLTRRVSTIYLPDRRRPMLPSLLSDSLCSLTEGKRRFSFVCDISVRRGDDAWKIEDIQYKNALIYIKKNYKYSNVECNKDYIQIKEITRALDKNVRQANDVIAYWMIQTNIFCAEKMSSYQNGIYRYLSMKMPGGCGGDTPPQTTILDDLPDNLDTDTKHVIRSWNYTSGQYSLYSPTVFHSGISNKTYIHITSPIRRLVDLLNQMTLIKNLGVTMSTKAEEFLTRWLGELDYINTTMRAIKKIQTDCFLLQKCVEDESVMETIYDGVFFDRLVKSDGSVTTYMVYLPALRLLSRYTVLTTNAVYENYQCAKFKIYLFEDKDNLRKKIKIGVFAP